MRWPDRDRLADGWPRQRILLTGASGGIGQALVAELAGVGARLLITGRHAATLETLAQRHPGQVATLAADLTQAEGRRRLVVAAEALGCTLLINAAGINRAEWFEHGEEAAIEALVATNLTATLLLTRALLPVLRRADHGRIVNIGSTFGHIGYPGQATYCATKFALHGFSEALRRELADTSVDVLYVAPRATRTAMNAPAMTAMNQALGNAMDSPERVARRIRGAIERGARETRLGGIEPLFTRLNGLLPGLIDYALRRQLPTIRRFLAAPEASARPNRDDTRPPPQASTPEPAERKPPDPA